MIVVTVICAHALHRDERLLRRIVKVTVPVSAAAMASPEHPKSGTPLTAWVKRDDVHYQHGRLNGQTTEKSSEADRRLSALAQLGTNGGNWGVSRLSAHGLTHFRAERLKKRVATIPAGCGMLTAKADVWMAFAQAGH